MLLLTLFGSLVSILIILLVYVKSPRASERHWLLIFISFAALWVLSANLQVELESAPETAVWFMRAAFIAALIMSYAMYRFAFSVSQTALKTGHNVVLILCTFGLSLLSLTNSVIELAPLGEGGTLQPERHWGYLLVLGLIMFFFIAALVHLWMVSRTVKGRRRLQFRIVAAGLLLGFIVGTLTNVVLPNLLDSTYPSRFAFLGVAAWTVPLTYAIVRHRFFNIKLAAARALAYVLTIASFGLVYLVITFATISFFFNSLDASLLQVYYFVVAVFIAISFRPLKLFFDQLTKKIFFKDTYATQDVLDTMGSILVTEVSVNKLVNKSAAALREAMQLISFEVILLGADGSARVPTGGKRLGDITELLAELKKTRGPSIIIEDKENSVLYDNLFDKGVAMIVRLQTSKDVIGYLMVGQRANGEDITAQDVELINLAADELAVAIQNALRFEEITHFNQTLKQEITEATAQLRDSNKKLHKLDEAKDEFISMASHQLRTPLTSVKGYLSMALEGDAGELTEPQRKLLEEAFTSSQRMVYLIGDFLNVSRLQTGKFILETRPVNIARLISQEIEQLQVAASRRNITLVYQAPIHFPTLLLDEDKMRQVIMNFIDNAIFYSRPGGKIVIELINTGRTIRLAVHDNGIGVPANERHKLFGKFFRATNARRVRPDGTGIGLFMAKKVVTAHGGSMIFETQEGKGSVFGFSLPLKPLHQQPDELKN